jgi:hypothetical protein
MKTNVLIAGALALAASFDVANGLEITNVDKTDYKVMVTPKAGKSAEVDIKAGATAKADCLKGGELSIGATKWECGGTHQKVEIKDGKFVAM